MKYTYEMKKTLLFMLENDMELKEFFLSKLDVEFSSNSKDVIESIDLSYKVPSEYTELLDMVIKVSCPIYFKNIVSGVKALKIIHNYLNEKEVDTNDI